jgi:hypothetical protein
VPGRRARRAGIALRSRWSRIFSKLFCELLQGDAAERAPQPVTRVGVPDQYREGNHNPGCDAANNSCGNGAPPYETAVHAASFRSFAVAFAAFVSWSIEQDQDQQAERE